MKASEEVEIRILPNGAVSFAALPEALLEVAAALNPRNKNIANRKAVLAAAKQRRENGLAEERKVGNGRA